MGDLAIAKIEIEVVGAQEFLGKEIPVIEGGFGEGKRVLTDKAISEIHNQQNTEIRRRITDNIKRFKEDIDFIDLKGVAVAHTLEEIGYSKQSITQAEHIYLLSERGYAKLIKIMDTDLAWEIHDKLIDEYFVMKKFIKEQDVALNQLSPELQMFKQIFDSVAKQQLENKKLQNAIIEVKKETQEVHQEIEDMRDIVALSSTDWRKDTQNLIARIAKNQGGFEHINKLRTESYELLNKRLGVSLETRLTNKRRRLAEEGASKTKRDKLNFLDVIVDDKKLIEGYIAIVKEMGIKYGV